MPIIVNIGSWILRGLTAIGAYNVVDTLGGNTNENNVSFPPSNDRVALVGLGGLISGYFLYKFLDKPKKKYRRRY